jgi:hypothetical protein
MSSEKNVSLKIGKHKDRNGGLTKSGIEKYNKETGSNLKMGVKGKPKTPEDYRRKGSFLTRFYNRKDIPPLVKPSGKPTRFALAAAAWGESVPTSKAAVKRLANKGKSLLSQYQSMKEKEKKSKKQNLSNSGNPYVELLSDNLLKIPLAMKGEFQHNLYPEVKFDDEDFGSIVNNFNNKVLGFTPYITYGHLKDNNLSIDAELKKGDCIKIEADTDILYGYFKSSPEAYEYVSKGEYEYNSGEFIRNYKDKKTGENLGTVLARTALTNSPFLPFENHKVEALSQSTTEVYSINQSIPVDIKHKVNNDYLLPDNSNINNNNSENINNPMPQELEDTKLDETASTIVEAESDSSSSTKTESQNIDEIVKSVLEKIQGQIPAPYKSTEPEKVVEPVVEELTPVVETKKEKKEEYKNISDIISSVTNSLTESFKVQVAEIKSQQKAVIDNLENKINELSSKLGQQEQVSQAFSNSLSQQQKKERYSALAKSGMSPAFIQKFSTIENAIETGNNVIKLSNSEGKEVDTAVTDMIAETILEALSSEAVEVQQFGNSNNQGTGIVADIKSLITANKEKAKKTSIN